MPEPKHAVKDVRACDVAGCKGSAERSVRAKNLKDLDIKLSSEGLRSVGLCKKHYKEYKKKTKKDRTYERLGW